MTKSVSIKPLSTNDFDLIIQFDKLIIPSLPEGMYHHSNQLMIVQCLESKLSIGLFEGEQLIGYRLTFTPKMSENNLGRLLEISDFELNKVAQFYGTAIHPNFRKKGLGYELVKANIDLISKQDLSCILVTTHPDNYISQKMFFKCGFKVVKAITFYNGLPRLLLKKILSEDN